MNIIKISLSILAVSFIATSAFAENAVDTWKRSVAAGLATSNGNTKKTEISAVGEAKRTTSDDEIQLKGDVYNSSSSGSMDSQKWNALAHYSYNLGEAKMWFGSGQVLANHDKFADIDYRVTPSLGLGRWISKSDDGNDWNAYAEGLVGYEMTKYIADGNDEQPVATAHVYGEKKVFDNSNISEDVSVIPSLEDNQFRVKSETVFNTVLKAHLSWDSRFIYDYNSDPAVGAKNTDTRLITGLKYDF